MLLPDNINPKDTVFFNGSIVLKMIGKYRRKDILELYQIVNNNNPLSFQLYLLCLDWLFLIGLASLNKDKLIDLC